MGYHDSVLRRDTRFRYKIAVFGFRLAVAGIEMVHLFFPYSKELSHKSSGRSTLTRITGNLDAKDSCGRKLVHRADAG